MKKRYLLAALLCTLAVAGHATIFSGTVTNASTGAPVASQKVYIIDSSAL